MSEVDKAEIKNEKAGWRKYIGILLLVLGIVILLFTFQPIISAYLDFYFAPTPKEDQVKVEIVTADEEITKEVKQDTQVVFVDNNFGLYIPKIKANAEVIKNVDPFNQEAYTQALISGVAHAKGSSLPSEDGNVFLFAHSAVNFYERRKYNVYFYLLNELRKDDPIYVSYQNVIYKYKVLEVTIVNPDEVKYLGRYMEEDTLTLMTCWPAGANIKRTIVTAIRDI